MGKSRVNDEDMIAAIKTSSSYREISRKVGLSPKGGNTSIKNVIKKYNIDISHLLGQGWCRGSINKKRRTPLDELLTKNSVYRNYDLRERLIEEGIKERKCENCNNTDWNHKLIPLEVHHINGIKDDQRLTNLALLCPNCHAQTDTYKIKNIKKDLFSTESTNKKLEGEKPSKIINIHCLTCGKKFRPLGASYKFCSNKCRSDSQKRFEISEEELRKLI
jgi:5-methylcytosine-specific restriction endonuclease McrA